MPRAFLSFPAKNHALVGGRNQSVCVCAAWALAVGVKYHNTGKMLH